MSAPNGPRAFTFEKVPKGRLTPTWYLQARVFSWL